ncbi:39167_t:CDS:2 [Gigaspora margarita]|uniref:39167_t:CDS:1 n=1 Tax=Gigaspora margarita TaxID=4874 RepID=A0ABM8VZG0_GIGMA|nr:39167_t:CDS:2 [Gigaspora margarita]
MSPPRRRYSGTSFIEKTKGGRYKCPSGSCLAKFTNHTSLIEHVQEIHRSIVLGVQYQLQSVQTQNDQRRDIELFRESFRKELADIIQYLELNKEKHLPLIECSWPVHSVFDESRLRILKLEETFKKFNSQQLRKTEYILNKRIATEKEKCKAQLKNLQDEVKKAKTELKSVRQRIEILEDSNQKLKEKFKKLEEKCDNLRKENEALRERNNDYFVVRYYESQQEIKTLHNHNLELTEEIKSLRERDRLLSIIDLISDDEL